jgi:hypothetical protein
VKLADRGGRLAEILAAEAGSGPVDGEHVLRRLGQFATQDEEGWSRRLAVTTARGYTSLSEVQATAR